MTSLNARLVLGLILTASAFTAIGGFSTARAGKAAAPNVLPTQLSGSAKNSLLTVKNTGAGAAIYGIGLNNTGITGRTEGGTNQAGIAGFDSSPQGSYSNGVTGNTANGAFGVRGVSGDSAEGGVSGVATSGIGLAGSATTGDALVASSVQGTGGIISSSTGPGAQITSTSGNGAQIASTNGVGATMYSPNNSGALVASFMTPAMASSYFTGNPFSLIVGAGEVNLQSVGPVAIGLGIVTSGKDPKNDYPIQTSDIDQSGNNNNGIFVVDGAGDVEYTGTLYTVIHTRGRLRATAFASKTTESTVEDTGSAQLVAGFAVVPLDHAYAQSIDLHRPYRVFVTPDGDNNGLYVASKTPTSFTVREVRGGRSTLGFDYRIVADSSDHPTDRMSIMTPAVEAKFFHRRLGVDAKVAQGSAIVPQAVKSLRDILEPGDPYRPKL